jgi:hypothetical protein
VNRREAKKLVGTAVLVDWHQGAETPVKIRVMVLATGTQFGHTQLLVTPQSGHGAFWVRKWTLDSRIPAG